jgi:hypothetical protein
MAKKRQGHYCKICGEYKSNEKFSGKGHAAHICKKCAGLPLTRRNELQRIGRVERIDAKLRLTKEEWDLLEKYAKSTTYPELKSYAAGVLEHKRMMRELRKPSIEELSYSDLEDDEKEEVGELLYNDLCFFIEDADAIPDEKQLKRITKDLFAEYLRYNHKRIVPDDDWNERVQQVLQTVVYDLRDEGIELE